MEKDPRTSAVIGAAMEVHRVLGPGFLEAVYHEALARELTKRSVPFRSEVEIPIFYKGERLSPSYRCDFVCYDTVTVEVKALARVTGLEEAQVINYLKASGHAVGLLLNFGSTSLEHRRLVLSPVKSAQSASFNRVKSRVERFEENVVSAFPLRTQRPSSVETAEGGILLRSLCCGGPFLS